VETQHDGRGTQAGPRVPYFPRLTPPLSDRSRRKREWRWRRRRGSGPGLPGTLDTAVGAPGRESVSERSSAGTLWNRCNLWPAGSADQALDLDPAASPSCASQGPGEPAESAHLPAPEPLATDGTDGKEPTSADHPSRGPRASEPDSARCRHGLERGGLAVATVMLQWPAFARAQSCECCQSCLGELCRAPGCTRAATFVFFVPLCGDRLVDSTMGWLATKGHKAHKRVAPVFCLRHGANPLELGGHVLAASDERRPGN
jgi:hypothetical protein